MRGGDKRQTGGTGVSLASVGMKRPTAGRCPTPPRSLPRYLISASFTAQRFLAASSAASSTRCVS